MFHKITLLAFSFTMIFSQAGFSQVAISKQSKVVEAKARDNADGKSNKSPRASTGIIKSPITVESIWKRYEFSSKGFAGFKGMKDGEHFTKLNQTESTFSITKHKYMQHDGVGEVLLTNKDLVFEGKAISIDAYDFNQRNNRLGLRRRVRNHKRFFMVI